MNQVVHRQNQLFVNRRVAKRNRIIRKKNVVKICVALFIELVTKRLIRKKPVPETNSMRQGCTMKLLQEISIDSSIIQDAVIKMVLWN